VIAGAAVLLLGWVGAPIGHFLWTRRALRRIEGSPWTLVLAATVLVGVLLLTTPPNPAPATPHRVGAWALRALAALATLLAALAWALVRTGWLVAVLGWLSLPLVVLLMGMTFAYVGRLHRLVGQRRMAHLADLAGVVLPLLWVGSQLVAGYPGPALQIPGLAAMGLGAVAVAALVPGYLRRS